MTGKIRRYNYIIDVQKKKQQGEKKEKPNKRKIEIKHVRK